jgi:hypothetical protein
MPVSLRKLFGAAVLGGVVLTVTAPPVTAQNVRYNYQFGLYPAASYNPFLPTLPMLPGRFAFSGYTMTGVGLNGPYSVSVGYYKNTALTVGSVGSPYSGGYYGGVGSGPGWAAGSGKIADKQRSAVASAQRSAKYNTETTAPAPDFDKWMKEQTNRREAKDPANPPAIDPALIHPPEEAILSGDALNRMVGLITELEGKGKRAESGLCGPDLMSAVVFEGGPAADAANQFRSTELVFPDPLLTMPFADLRDSVSKAYSTVAFAAHSGKKVNAADVDRLLRELAKARDIVAPLMKEASVDDAKTISRFYTRLEAATKYLKDPNATGVAGEKWSSVGATTAEVVKHANRFKLRFGPVAAGEEEAYESLHRGLLTYYAGLLRAK